MRSVLVTGGAGFIGTHLIKRLLADEHRVTVIERYSSKKKNMLEELFGRKISVVWGDIAEFQIPKSKTQNIDWVFHLIGIPNDFDAGPRFFHTAHVDATVNVLEAARRAGVSRFLYPGSATCYGHADFFPTPETAPIRLEYPYAFTKYIGEQYVLHWGNVYKLPVVVLRPFSVYGPRLHPEGSWGSLSRFIIQKVNNNIIQVTGDGNQARDYAYISDVVDAFMKAAQSHITNEVFNVGTGKATSINTLVRLFGGRKKYIPGKPVEIPYMCADITKIQAVFGWNPTISLDQGVQLTLNSMRKILP